MSDRFSGDAIFEFVFSSCAQPDLPAAAILRIEREAQRNNLAQGLSGEMSYSDGRFTQVMEGGAEAIMSLAARIMIDPRHSRINVLTLRPVRHRRYGTWRSFGMGSTTTGLERDIEHSENVTLLRSLDFDRADRDAMIGQGTSIHQF